MEGIVSSLVYSVAIVLARLIWTEYVYKSLPHAVNRKQEGTRPHDCRYGFN